MVMDRGTACLQRHDVDVRTLYVQCMHRDKNTHHFFHSVDARGVRGTDEESTSPQAERPVMKLLGPRATELLSRKPITLCTVIISCTWSLLSAPVWCCISWFRVKTKRSRRQSSFGAMGILQHDISMIISGTAFVDVAVVDCD